jgi:urea carboxylase
MSRTIDVLTAGLETSVQELPGRIGYWEQGFPPSGPMDIWSFRQANLLVGNAPDTAALECQFVGPELRFSAPALVAVTGADMTPMVDGVPVESWTTLALEAGQTLTLGPALKGARAYVAVAGGIDIPPVLGSRATFHMAGVGGVDGQAIKAGQRLPLGEALAGPIVGTRVAAEARPRIDGGREWSIEVVPGPNDDWLDEPGRARFLGADWKLTAKSNRTGFRLQGPEWSFSPLATDKRPEHGSDPSNILDHGYPFGAVNLAGQTPIILVNDGPSTGGFINPYTVITAAFWKLGQSRPGDIYRFRAVTVGEAQDLRRALDARCTAASLQPG